MAYIVKGSSLCWLLLAFAAVSVAPMPSAAGPVCCALDPAYVAASDAAPPWTRKRCPSHPWRLLEAVGGEESSLPLESTAFSAADCSPEACGPSSPVPSSPPSAFVQCLNIATPSQSPPDTEPRTLRALGVWRSAKAGPRLGPGAGPVPFSVITQVTVDRLVQLWAQCRSWGGAPLSAAVYLGLPSGGPAGEAEMLQRCAIEQMGALFMQAESTPSACHLDMTLLAESHATVLSSTRYPINALRNIARLQARTEMVAVLDVDQMPSPYLASTLLEQQQPVLDLCRQKAVVVLPAFDIVGEDVSAAVRLAETLVAGSKAALVARFTAGDAIPFDGRRFPQGHAATNYSKWITAQDFYDIPYAGRYEPYLVISRQLAPWHDARFRGYGQNKIVHIAHIHALGYRFVIHPHAFIVHRRHEMSPARLQFSRDMDVYSRAARAKVAQEHTGFVRVTEQFKVAKAAMMAGTFVPFLDPSTVACRATLSWWNTTASASAAAAADASASALISVLAGGGVAAV